MHKDEAVWRGVAEILSEPERPTNLAREELRRRGPAKSEKSMQEELQSLDRKIVRAREALNRLARYHADRGTLGEEGFESAAESIKSEIDFLTYERNRLSRSTIAATKIFGVCTMYRSTPSK